MNQVELVFAQPCSVGESPIWDSQSGSLWWVDIVRKTIHRLNLSTNDHRSWLLAEMVGSIALGLDGSIVAAQETAIEQLKLLDSGEIRSVGRTSVDHAVPGMRCNDGRTDPRGRFVCSTMFNDMTAGKSVGALFSLERGHVQRVYEPSVIVGNGLAFSLSGRRMYVSDSHPSIQTVWACDYDPDLGRASQPRPFVDFKPLNGRPDGAAIDADDCYWICANDGAAVYRFTPDGKLDKTVPLPVKKPSMCAFGGANFDTLFVTSIRPDGVDLSDQPLAGCVFAVNPGVKGREELRFSA